MLLFCCVNHTHTSSLFPQFLSKSCFATHTIKIKSDRSGLDKTKRLTASAKGATLVEESASHKRPAFILLTWPCLAAQARDAVTANVIFCGFLSNFEGPLFKHPMVQHY